MLLHTFAQPINKQAKTMKIKYGFLAIGALFFMASCGGSKAHNEETAENEVEVVEEDMDNGTMEEVTYVVNPESSNIRWEGGTSGANVYSHFGNLKVQEGNLVLKGDKIVGGNFVVDMLSIEPMDQNYSEEHPASDLVGHLSTGDFFLVEEYPTASFEITSANNKEVKGNLTIRDKTNEETIALDRFEVNEDGQVVAHGKLVFDRQKYDVNWKHYLKDVLLKDDIELQIDLAASK
ncbi:YceI family protein [bacterium]|nr:YceI family protein [bacterium]